MKKHEMSAEKIVELQEFVDAEKLEPVSICTFCTDGTQLHWSRVRERYEVFVKGELVYSSDDLTPAVRKWEHETWLRSLERPVRL